MRRNSVFRACDWVSASAYRVLLSATVALAAFDAVRVAFEAASAAAAEALATWTDCWAKSRPRPRGVLVASAMAHAVFWAVLALSAAVLAAAEAVAAIFVWSAALVRAVVRSL